MFGFKHQPEHKRRTTTSETFNKDFLKLVNKLVYGKTKETARIWMKEDFITGTEGYKKLEWQKNYGTRSYQDLANGFWFVFYTFKYK